LVTGESSNKPSLAPLLPVKLSTMLSLLNPLFWFARKLSCVAVLTLSSSSCVLSWWFSPLVLSLTSCLPLRPPLSNRSAAGDSGEKLGKLVSDLSLGARLLAELDGCDRRLRAREARTVALRRELMDVLLCCETDRCSSAVDSMTCSLCLGRPVVSMEMEMGFVSCSNTGFWIVGRGQRCRKVSCLGKRAKSKT
jgi:hypothetical protein